MLGIITLSDVLRYIIGESAIGESVEPTPEVDSGIPTPSTVLTSTESDENSARTEEVSQPIEEPPAPSS